MPKMQTCISRTAMQMVTAELRYECYVQFLIDECQIIEFFSGYIVNFVKHVRSMSHDADRRRAVRNPSQEENILNFLADIPESSTRVVVHHVNPTASSVAIQAHVAPSLGAPVSSRTIRRHLAEGHFGSRCPLRVLPLTRTHRSLRLEWCRVRGNWTAAEWN
ncbi:transposable element Tcb2 transposase [Trichonephila clavipes]|nr:transposable element Tcb2 transposase [Trichonephila clavipes]